MLLKDVRSNKIILWINVLSMVFITYRYGVLFYDWGSYSVAFLGLYIMGIFFLLVSVFADHNESIRIVLSLVGMLLLVGMF